MATLLFGDRVQDVSTSTGSSDFTLAGTPPTGYVAFDSIFGHGGTYNFYYCIQSSTLSDWEVGLGHLSAATTLVRDTILASSNAGSVVSFSAGTKTVFSTIAAIGVAFPGVPQNSQSAAYTTVLADANKHILHPTADNNARTFTIDSNANVAYAVGTAITFVNQINTLTIALASDTLTWAKDNSTGSRTLAAGGMATALKIASTVWIINGVQLT